MMKNSLKVIVSVLILLTSLGVNAQNGFVKQIKDFEDHYIGFANNQHLFLVQKTTTETHHTMKIYDENMEFIKELKTPFHFKANLFHDNSTYKTYKDYHSNKPNDYGTGDNYDNFYMKLSVGDFFQVVNLVDKDNTEYSMLMVVIPSFKNENENFIYEYDEVKLYETSDLMTPKYTAQVNRMPSQLSLNAKQSKEFYKNFIQNCAVHVNSFEDKIAIKFSTDLTHLSNYKDLEWKEGENPKNDYLVIFNNKLEIQFKGFLPSKVYDTNELENNLSEYKISDYYEVINDNIFIDRSYLKISTSSTYKKHKIYHVKYENDKTKSNNEIVIGDKFYTYVKFDVSLDKKSIIGVFNYWDSEDDMGAFKKAKGYGLFKYNIEESKMEKVQYFPYNKGEGFYAGLENETPFFIGDKIIIMRHQHTPKGDKAKNYIRNVHVSFFTLNQNLEKVAENKIVYSKSDWNATSYSQYGFKHFYIHYNKIGQKLSVLYLNAALKEKEEIGIEENKKGSHLVQLDYTVGGRFKESYIPLPSEIKYQKIDRSGVSFDRSSFISLPYRSNYAANYQLLIVEPTNVYNDKLTQIKLNN